MKIPNPKPLLLALLFLPLLWSSISCSKSSTDSHSSREDALAAGLEALRVFNFGRSYEVFEQLYHTSQPEDEDWALITYSYAISSWLNTPISEEAVTLAVHRLEELVEQAPDSIYVPSALLDLGRIAEISDFRGDPTDVTSARQYYERVRKEYPNTEMSVRATLFLAQTYAQTLETDAIHKAIDLLETCMAEQTDDEWIGLIGQYVGELYHLYLDQPEKAIDPLLKATEAGLPRHAETDRVLWRIGVLAENAGRDLLAAQAYTRIMQDFPRTVYRSVSQERLEQIQKDHPDAEIRIPEMP